jgi:hypothetical protein
VKRQTESTERAGANCENPLDAFVSMLRTVSLSVSVKIRASRDDFHEESGARLCRPRPAAARSHTKLGACFERPPAIR